MFDPFVGWALLPVRLSSDSNDSPILFNRVGNVPRVERRGTLVRLSTQGALPTRLNERLFAWHLSVVLLLLASAMLAIDRVLWN